MADFALKVGMRKNLLNYSMFHRLVRKWSDSSSVAPVLELALDEPHSKPRNLPASLRLLAYDHYKKPEVADYFDFAGSVEEAYPKHTFLIHILQAQGYMAAEYIRQPAAKQRWLHFVC
jgi:hypothetical protein